MRDNAVWSNLELYEYNTRSELTYFEQAWDDGEYYMTWAWNTLSYDPIGNRLTFDPIANEEFPWDERAYTTNELNQYEAISNPTVNYAYDADGNMTSTGTRALAWDAENRLVSAAPASSPVNGGKKAEFKYDYLGRRVEKKVSTYNGGAWSVTSTERFVYDGWNVVLVLDGSNNTTRKYTWGLDFSGQSGSGVAPGVSPVVGGIHGAGGIGGLLAVEETSGTFQGRYWYLYDARGNVIEVVSAAGTHPVKAYYEYDPFGSVAWSWGDYRDANPFRFSTKWYDGETGLLYYGYRYLGVSPSLGRWLCRDPIGEAGGLMLYNFIRNNPNGGVDPVGLDTVDEVVGTCRMADAFHHYLFRWGDENKVLLRISCLKSCRETPV